MKKALIFQGMLVEVAIADFPVHSDMNWIEVTDDVTTETHKYDGISVVLIPPTVMFTALATQNSFIPVTIL